MVVRRLVSSDREPVQRLAAALWPNEVGPFDVPDERVDGAESEPCPHVEGWYVAPTRASPGSVPR
jgi:hypothetical protein